MLGRDGSWLEMGGSGMGVQEMAMAAMGEESQRREIRGME